MSYSLYNSRELKVVVKFCQLLSQALIINILTKCRVFSLKKKHFSQNLLLAKMVHYRVCQKGRTGVLA
jgi:hypothetical protein